MMSRWFRVAVPLGLAAVLVSVLAIGFGSPSTHAAKPGAEPTSSAPACNGSVNTVGQVGSGGSVVYEAKFCSDPESNLTVQVYWNRYSPDKDLALRVTAPNGLEFYSDMDGRAEILTVWGPLQEGTWRIEVINDGSRRVNYDLTYGFGQ